MWDENDYRYRDENEFEYERENEWGDDENEDRVEDESDYEYGSGYGYGSEYDLRFKDENEYAHGMQQMAYANDARQTFFSTGKQVANDCKLPSNPYISYDPQQACFVKNQNRPNNQSNLTVQRKVAIRIKLKQMQGKVELTPLEAIFLNHFEPIIHVKKKSKFPLEANTAAMCHHMAISCIIDSIVDAMNACECPEILKALIAKFDKVADTMVTTDDEKTGRSYVKSLFAFVTNTTLPPGERIDIAQNLIRRLNRTSKNLLPGNASTNSSIQDYIDPHINQDVITKEWVETESSVKIRAACLDFFLSADCPIPQPKAIAESGVTFFQSSSVQPSLQNPDSYVPIPSYQ